MKGRSGLDHDFIESQKGSTLVRPVYLTLEHYMASDPVVAAHHLGKTSLQFIRPEVREETEFAEIDAEDRGLLIAHLPGRPQDGPIASQHQGEIGFDAA